MESWMFAYIVPIHSENMLKVVYNLSANNYVNQYATKAVLTRKFDHLRVNTVVELNRYEDSKISV